MYEKTKKEVAIKLSGLIALRKKLENNPVVLQYQAFLTLPRMEKDRITLLWDEYYAAVHKSKAYLRLETQSKAFKIGEMATVKELAKQATSQIESNQWELTPPEGQDPRWMPQSEPVTQYYNTIHKIESLTGKEDAEAIEAFL